MIMVKWYKKNVCRLKFANKDVKVWHIVCGFVPPLVMCLVVFIGLHYFYIKIKRW